MRLADYVPAVQLKQLKAEGVPIGRDPEFGVVRNLQEEPDAEAEGERRHYVRPVEVKYLTVGHPRPPLSRALELTNIPSPSGPWNC